jgi:hypothetical protein
VTPCARGSRSRERRPGITWGCPNRGNHERTPITCHFCAMQRDLMCDATYVTLEHTRFCPQCGVPRGAVRGKKPRFRLKSACSGRFWGRFRAISATLCQRPGTSVTWRTLAESARPARTFSRVHRLRAHRFAGARGAAWRQPVRSRRRPARPASVRYQESGTDRRRLGLPLASGAAPGPRARLRLARHSGSRPRRGRGPVVRRARY